MEAGRTRYTWFRTEKSKAIYNEFQTFFSPQSAATRKGNIWIDYYGLGPKKYPVYESVHGKSFLGLRPLKDDLAEENKIEGPV